jgi:uncharacterized membrane protein YphA (DoxX/SURF4 family)
VVPVGLLLAGAGVMWRRTTAWAAGLLAAYYTVFVVVLMDGRVVLRHAREYLAYSNLAEQLALAAGAVIVFAGAARLNGTLAQTLVRLAQIAFGLCAILFGGAHFLYMNMTAPLVPKWLPPGQVFWGYATGIAHIAAGLAILTGVQARLAAMLLTLMFAAFQVLVHLRLLAAEPMNHGYWTENALNLALTGAAWVVADSLARSKR